MDRDVERADGRDASGRDTGAGAGMWGARVLNILHFIYSCAFWVLLILALVLASTGVESKFIYTDF